MSDTLPIPREHIGDIIERLRKIEDLIDDVPHKLACAIFQQTSDIEGLITEPLPGHEIAGCECCDRVLGIEEVHHVADVQMCDACIAAEDAA